MPIASARNYLQSLGSKPVMLVIHTMADLDALCAAYLIYRYLANASIVACDHLNTEAKLFSEHLGLKILSAYQVDFKNFEAVIALDASSREMLPNLTEEIDLVIDHHQPPSDPIKARRHCVQIVPSATELVCEILKPIWKPDVKMLEAALVAILSDTSFFKTSSSRTFGYCSEILAHLEKEGRDYHEISSFANSYLDDSQKIGVAKSLGLLKYKMIGDTIICSSTAGLCESHVASGLIEIGMDVAFVAKGLPPSEGGGCKVSARANALTNLDMAKLMGKLGVFLNGAGGGHSKAAGATCKATPEDAVKKCVELATKELEK